ncbi:helix-turn-helix domain-containing protein [Actinokineospora globicatena]|nr:helix-turn-helix transcriptional regulator [Actinokineospora globicatena]
MAELGITEQQLAARSRVSRATLNELAHNTLQRSRNPLTLSRLSRALNLDPGHIHRIAYRPAVRSLAGLEAALARGAPTGDL